MFLFTQCRRVRPFLRHYADNGLEDLERKWIREHLNHCDACQSRLTEHRSQIATLATLGLDDLLRVRLDLEAELSGPKRFLRTVSALLMLGLCLFFLHSSLLLAIELFYPNPAKSPQANLILVLSADSPVMPEKITLSNEALPKAPLKSGASSDPAATILSQIPVPEPKTPKQAPLQKSPEPAPKAEMIPKPVAPKKPFVYDYPRLVLLAKTPDNSPKGPPKAVADVLARLGIEPGFRYGEMLFFPIVDNTENDQTRLRATRLAFHYLEELNPPFPSRILASRVSRRETWPFLPGLLLEAPWGWRIVRRGPVALSDGQTLIPVISVSDPDVLFLERLGVRVKRFRRKQVPVPPMAPRRVRRTLLTGKSSGITRRAVWDSFLDGDDGVPKSSKDPFVPADSLKSQKLARVLRIRRIAIETEISDLNRRLRHNFASKRGLRGVAMSIGDKAYSIDVFPDGHQTIRALPSLVQGLALDAFESSQYTPLAGSGRALLKERVETTDIHRLLLGLTRNLKGRVEDGYSYINKERGLKSVFRLELQSEKRLAHLVILKDP